MTWSLRLFRIAGTDVKVHVTFLLLLGFFCLQGGTAAALMLLGIRSLRKGSERFFGARLRRLLK